MASAWGDSWGDAWGDSWGSTTPPPPVGGQPLRSGFIVNMGRLMGRGTMGIILAIGISWHLMNNSPL